MLIKSVGAAAAVLAGLIVIFHSVPWAVEAATDLPRWMLNGQSPRYVVALTKGLIVQYQIIGGLLVAAGMLVALQVLSRVECRKDRQTAARDAQ